MSTAESEWMAMTVRLERTVTRPWFLASPGRFPYLTWQFRQGTSFSCGKSITLHFLLNMQTPNELRHFCHFVKKMK